MSRTAFIIFIALVCAMFVQVFPALSQVEQKGSEWTGKLKDGTVITKTDLKEILKDHEKLHEIQEKMLKAGENGKTEIVEHLQNEVESFFHPVNLAGADLSRVDLSGAVLVGANLVGANLIGANLSGATLSGAQLKNAGLNEANLKGTHFERSTVGGIWFGAADLSGSDLSGADLSQSDLSGIDLTEAKLTKAILYEANLIGTNLNGSDLRKASLTGADLGGANLTGVDLRQTYLSEAELAWANLTGADLSNTYLSEAKLHSVDLTGANLSGADLHKADLSEAKLIEAKLFAADLSEVDLRNASLAYADLRLADLSNADLRGADLRGADAVNAVLYETKIMGADGSELKFTEMQASNRVIERLTTYSVKLFEWSLLGEGGFLDIVKSIPNLIFFDFTCQYGLKPGRPLIILMCFIPYFAFFYIFALTSKNRKTGIWLVLSKKRVIESTIKERPFRLTQKFSPGSSPAGILNKMKFKICCWYRIVRIGFYFSLLSALNIGWRDLNMKALITRMQRREYGFRATGWARSLAGIQSLLSIFLLALWLLTTFGQPF
jgi:uncharacterized protein YjbI with pentapeptide repeats